MGWFLKWFTSSLAEPQHHVSRQVLSASYYIIKSMAHMEHHSDARHAWSSQMANSGWGRLKVHLDSTLFSSKEQSCCFPDNKDHNSLSFTLKAHCWDSVELNCAAYGHKKQNTWKDHIGYLANLIGCQHDDISAFMKALWGSQVTNSLRMREVTN